MTSELETILRRGIVSLLEPPPDQSYSDWCVQNLYIPPPSSSPGPLSFDGREYARALVDLFGDPSITDVVACWGSQTSKTTSIMAGLCASLALASVASIWAMPNTTLAKSFSNSRWKPMVEASPGMVDLIPRGAQRHRWAALEQKLGASLLNFIGSNSPANLSSRPAGLAIADEIDKFNEGTKREANAVNLLEQRTKDFANPKRIKASTPTVPEGLIWQEFLKGDQQRYYVPCPGCGKFVLFVWSKTFTIFKLTGHEAFIVWDKEARRKDRSWDLDRVRRSARAECWSCGFHIQDGHKTKIVREGIWKPTNPSAPRSFRSLHLPSLYASSPETGFGSEAVKFLQAKQSLLGLQGFINGELAEPYEGQDVSVERVEIISPENAPPLAEKTLRILGGDCQRITPHWFVCREFDASGNSRLVEFGTWNTWQEFREIQIRLGVEDEDVGIDSGYRATDVYPECKPFGKVKRVGDGNGGTKLAWFGWTPMKGQPEERFWLTKKGEKKLYGHAAAPGHDPLQILEFNGPQLKDILWRLRNNKTLTKWELNPTVNAEYFKHMDSAVKKSYYDSRTRRVRQRWEKRTQNWPDHILDCEVECLAKAMESGLLSIEPEAPVSKPDDAPPSKGKTYIIKP